MLGWAGNSRRISLPGIRDVGVELEFITIRIEDIQTMGDRVIGCADEGDAGRLQFFQCLPEFFVGIPDFESDMIETRFWRMLWSGRDTAEADEEHLMMSTASSEEGGATHVALDFGEAEDIAVKRTRALQVRDIEDDVTEFVDFHSFE